MARLIRQHSLPAAAGRDEAISSWHSLVAAVALIFLTLLAYGHAYSAGYIWDDDQYVFENPNLRSVEGLARIWFMPRCSPQYYPLVFTTYWLEYRLWGLAPAGYHVVNVLLHAASAVLLWVVLRRLEVPASWVAAAVFALHPVHVESVAWITERKNTLAGLFYLASALCFLGFMLPAGAAPSARSGRNKRWGLYAASLACYLAALLSKTVVASLPAALLLVVWWKRGRLARRDVLAAAPMFLLGVPLALFTAWLERHHVGAQGPEWSWSLLERCLIAGRTVWFYAGKLVYPVPLAFVYPRWQIDATAAWQYVFPLSAVAVAVGVWVLRHRLGRGPAAGLWFFGGTLFPALGFANVYPMRYSFVADHFQYLASIGLIALGVGIAAEVLQRTVARRWRRAAAIVLLGSFGLLTWRQCYVYTDLETLYRDTLAKNPECEMAHTNLGLLLCNTGRPEEAAFHFRQSLRIAPNNPVRYNHLATALIDLGELEEAERCLTRAIAMQPHYAEAMANLGLLRQRQRRPDEARREFERAVDLAPKHGVVHYSFAAVLQEQGDLAAARRHYERAIELAPDVIAARYNLAQLLIQQGDYAAAVAHLEACLRTAPPFLRQHAKCSPEPGLCNKNGKPSNRDSPRLLQRHSSGTPACFWPGAIDGPLAVPAALLAFQAEIRGVGSPSGNVKRDPRLGRIRVAFRKRRAGGRFLRHRSPCHPPRLHLPRIHPRLHVALALLLCHVEGNLVHARLRTLRQRVLPLRIRPSRPRVLLRLEKHRNVRRRLVVNVHRPRDPHRLGTLGAAAPNQ